MKKLMLVVLLGGFLFTSCQKDDLSTQTELESVDGKGKDKIKIENGDNGSTCVVKAPELPMDADFCVDAKDTPDSYFDITIASGLLAGSYGAWCVDQQASLDNLACVSANVYSSYPSAAVPDVGIADPSTLPAVNWLINENVIGTASLSGGDFTMGDVQRAIWALLGEPMCVVCEFLQNEGYDDARRDELVAAALLNNDFVPGANQLTGVILEPKAGEQTIIIFIPVECEEEPTCETAFAYDDSDATCFDDYGFDRWGWTIGPLSDGASDTYDVYAGAGQCDLSKGTFVGTVDVSYSGGILDVTYSMVDGFTINEEHTYAGANPIPTDKNGELTVAPGQYADASDDPLSGPIYVILHTEVCGDYED